MEGSDMFKKDQDFPAVMSSLSSGRKTAFVVLAIGGIFPVFFLGIVRLIYWGVAFQMASLRRWHISDGVRRHLVGVYGLWL